VFRFEIVKRELEPFRLVFVRVCCFAGRVEGLGEALVLAFETLGGRLRVGQLNAQLLEGHFEVPILFFEFV
jgi:hypothetical protein